MNKHFIPAIVFAAGLAAATHSTQAQLLTNGSFETPVVSVFLNVPAGQNFISPWVVDLVGVDVVRDSNVVIIGDAFHGRQYLDLDGTPGPGKLIQAFSTTPGLLYAVTFAYANDYTSQPSASATIRIVDGLGERLNQTIIHSTSQAGDLKWTVFNNQFVAAQSTTSIEFTSLSVADSTGGILLDAIAVEVVPEPTTFALLLSGAALCLLRRRG